MHDADHLRGEEDAGVVVVYGSYVSAQTAETEPIVSGIAHTNRGAETLFVHGERFDDDVDEAALLAALAS